MTPHIHIPEKDFRIAFLVSLWLKAANAFVQIALGTILLFTADLAAKLSVIVDAELAEDPGDFIATHFATALSHLPVTGQMYGAIYLLSHGAIKIFLVWGMMKNRLWAYPAAIVAFSLFLIYQIVILVQAPSIMFGALAIFDTIVVWLVVHEYRYILKTRFKGANLV